MIKIVLYRGFGNLKLFDYLLGQYEGKIVDLLENSEYNRHYMHAFILKTI